MKIAFSLEYSLGHVTHADNLRAYLGQRPDIEPLWLEIPYVNTPLPLFTRLIPGVKGNWSFRASLAARYGMRKWIGVADAAFFHTQATALLSANFMYCVPSIISLDATPLQVDAMGGAYAHGTMGTRSERVKFSIYQLVFKRAKRLVTWSQWAKDSLVADYGVDPDIVSVIPPGIDLSTWGAKPKHAPLGNRQVLFVGADFVRKGGDTLLAAFRRAKSDGARIELDIVTKTPPIGVLEDGERVHLGLHPGDSKLRELYDAADIFAFPTRGDCSPLAIMEAMASGLPVISTKIGAIPEMLDFGKCGKLIDIDSVEQLTDALMKLSGNANMILNMSRNAKAFALEHFSAEKNYSSLVGLIEKIGLEGRSHK
jgi:glycosyltransferase involved in cell wall biosynthesis